MAKPSGIVAPFAFVLIMAVVIGVARANDWIPLWLAAVIVVVSGVATALWLSRGRFVRHR